MNTHHPGLNCNSQGGVWEDGQQGTSVSQKGLGWEELGQVTSFRSLT